MTQDAIITKLLPNDMAEVVVTRTTACGSNCGNCESCIFQNELKTPAHNLIGAHPGQRVIIESESRKIYGAAILVYIMPLAFFFVGYAIAYALGLREGLRVLTSFLALAVSAVVIVASQRRKKNNEQFTFNIIELVKGSEDL